MNKSTDTNTTIPKLLTKEEKAVQKSLKLQAEHKKERERLKAQGLSEMEILYEMDVEL